MEGYRVFQPGIQMSMNATLRLPTNGQFVFWLTVLFLVPALPTAAQQYHITYTPNYQEALLLQLIEQVDGAAKIQQMEDFLKRYPTHPSVPWIYAYQQDYFTRTNDVDKALAAGEKLFALNPDD